MGPLIPLFWTSGDVFSGFHSHSGFCLIRARVKLWSDRAKANVKANIFSDV